MKNRLQKGRLTGRRDAKVALLGRESRAVGRQKSYAWDAKVALLRGKSATFAIQVLWFGAALVAKSLQSSDLRRSCLEGDIFAREAFSPRRRDSGGGYFR